MTHATRIELTGVPDLPLVAPGDDLAGLIAGALDRSGLRPSAGDVVVIAHKIVSKAEDRFVDLAEVEPSERALTIAAETANDPRLVEVIASGSTGILRRRAGLLITEHRLGYVMANAGIDQSNVAPQGGRVLLLPLNPDRSAETLRQRLSAHYGCDPAVIINDSFGRAWRRGTVGVALGVAGVCAVCVLLGHGAPGGPT